MTGVVVVDTNLLILLVVGSVSRTYIARHKRLGDYCEDDFVLLVELIGQFSDMVLVPHVLTETGNLLVSGIDPPARGRVLDRFRTLITTTLELAIPSAEGARREEFGRLGLTDAVLLHLCGMRENGLDPTLITADQGLADAANAQGYAVIDYKQEFQQ